MVEKNTESHLSTRFIMRMLLCQKEEFFYQASVLFFLLAAALHVGKNLLQAGKTTSMAGRIPPPSLPLRKSIIVLPNMIIEHTIKGKDEDLKAKGGERINVEHGTFV